MDYKASGVDTEHAAKLIQNLKSVIENTHLGSKAGKVVGGFGGFAGAFRLNKSFQNHDIVAATDGVGTKIQLYRKYRDFSGIGQDLVAMCINDLYCAGALPLFFLDYIACGKLDGSWYQPVLRSIANACNYSGIALLGGETAEHPGVMADDDFDLAGFAVGVSSPEQFLPKPESIREGDKIFSFPSSGLHSNGFSLIRKVLPQWQKENPAADSLLANPDFVSRVLLRPTRIYWFVPEMLNEVKIKALVHVTGGGIYENLPRVLPEGLGAYIHTPSAFDFAPSLIFQNIVPRRAQFSTFNMGNGMLAIGSAKILARMHKYDRRVCEIGEVVKSAEKKITLSGIDT